MTYLQSRTHGTQTADLEFARGARCITRATESVPLQLFACLLVTNRNAYRLSPIVLTIYWIALKRLLQQQNHLLMNRNIIVIPSLISSVIIFINIARDTSYCSLSKQNFLISHSARSQTSGFDYSTDEIIRNRDPQRRFSVIIIPN